MTEDEWADRRILRALADGKAKNFHQIWDICLAAGRVDFSVEGRLMRMRRYDLPRVESQLVDRQLFWWITPEGKRVLRKLDRMHIGEKRRGGNS